MPRLSTLISLDAQAALAAAQAPSADNPFVTSSQLSGGGSSQDGLVWFGDDVEDGDDIEPGFVYNIPAPGPESSLTLHIAHHEDVVNKRLAFKVVAGHEGRIVVVAYEGDALASGGKSAQFIENDAGEFGYEAAIDLRSPGEYREWQMEFGTWMLVSRIAGDDQVPEHAFTHESGNLDEIDVTGLHGVLADPQPPRAHATSHANGGADKLNVAGLSGALADPQRANIVVASPATNLSVGVIADGEFLRRSGTTLIGAAPTITTSPNPQWWDPPAAPNPADFEGTDNDLKGWQFRRQTDWAVVTPDITPINTWTAPAANTFRISYGGLRRSHLSVQPAPGFEVALCKQFPANSFPNGVQHSIRFSLPQQQLGPTGTGTIVKFDWNLDSGGTKPAIDWRGQQIWAKSYGTGGTSDLTQIGVANYSNYTPNDQFNSVDLRMAPLDYEFILCWDKTDTQTAWLRSGSVLKRLNAHAVGWPGSRNGVVWLVIRFGYNGTGAGGQGWQGGGAPIFHLDYIRQVDNEQVS